MHAQIFNLLKDINPCASNLPSEPKDIVAINEIIYFTASTPTTGREVWRSDGTAAGTILLKDIYPGVETGQAEGLTSMGGMLYFSAFDPDHGKELWASNGTSAGTKRVKDIIPGMGSSIPSELTSVGGTLFLLPLTWLTGRNYGKVMAQKQAPYWLKIFIQAAGTVLPHT